MLKLLLQLFDYILRNFELSLKLLKFVGHGSRCGRAFSTAVYRGLSDLSLMFSGDHSLVGETVILTRNVAT
jgi:hypothetical protein